jgi:WD40 repeat protein
VVRRVTEQVALTATTGFQQTVDSLVAQRLATATRTPSVTPTATIPTDTPTATSLIQTVIAQTLAEVHNQTATAAAQAVIQQTVSKYLTQTATLLPSPTPTETPQIATIIAQLHESEQTQTATVAYLATVTAVANIPLTATAESLVKGLVVGYQPLGVDNIAQLKTISTLKGHSKGVTRVDFSPNGTELASASSDASIILWNVRAGTQLSTIKGFSPRLSVAFSSDGSRLAYSSSDSTIRIYGFASKSEGAIYKAFTVTQGGSVVSAGDVTSVALSPDGNILAAGAADKIIRVWDLRTGAQIATLLGHTNSVLSVAISPDGARVISGGGDGTVRIWDIGASVQLQMLRANTAVNSVAISPDNHAIASGSTDGSVRVWNADSGAVLATLTGHQGAVTSVAFSRDGTCLASGGVDKTIRLWDVKGGKLITALKPTPEVAISTLDFSPDGARMASGNTDGSVTVWAVPATSTAGTTPTETTTSTSPGTSTTQTTPTTPTTPASTATTVPTTPTVPATATTAATSTPAATVSPTLAPTSTLKATTSAATGPTFYLDAERGNDRNPGTEKLPWKTIPWAIASLTAGDTVIFKQGIYTLDNNQTWMLGPSGKDINKKTTYKAADGARVIITGSDGKPVTIHLMSYMHVEGLWFGGTWDAVNGIDTSGRGESKNPIFVLGGPLNDIVNCTFFGYAQTGNGGDYLLFQGNRSVLTGGGDLSHGIYLSGHDGTTDEEDNHAILDNNIFIGKEIDNPNYGKVDGAPKTYLFGLGIQSWHIHNNNIITRNFVAQHIANAIDANEAGDDVRSELVANNFWWKNGTSEGSDYPHGFWISKHVNYFNNLGGPRGGIASGDIQQTTNGNTFKANAFTLGSANHLLPDAPVVSEPSPLNLSEDQIAAAVGTTPGDIDAAIAQLQDSFAIGVKGKTVQDLLKDQTIEPNFAKLHFNTPQGSPLYQKGYAWFNPLDPTKPSTGTCMNIGPGAIVPASPGEFWAAFRAMGMQEYDDSGKPFKPSSPTYPYPAPSGSTQVNVEQCN